MSNAQTQTKGTQMKAKKIVAEICLYGTSQIGAGWIAQLEDGTTLGNGEPREGRSFTHAIFQACNQILRINGMCGGRPRQDTIRVYAPGGERMAETSLRHPDYFGDLKWTAAIQYEVSAESLMAAAE